jgi:hypothetical protein
MTAVGGDRVSPANQWFIVHSPLPAVVDGTFMAVPSLTLPDG